MYNNKEIFLWIGSTFFVKRENNYRIKYVHIELKLILEEVSLPIVSLLIICIHL